MNMKEQLAEKYANKHYNPLATYKDCVKDFLAGCEAAEPKWISIKDELPEPCTEVLCFSPFGYGVELLLFDGDKKFYTLSDTERPVTHWMPLPKTPQL